MDISRFFLYSNINTDLIIANALRCLIQQFQHLTEMITVTKTWPLRRKDLGMHQVIDYE